jgi:hypothetical protein
MAQLVQEFSLDCLGAGQWLGGGVGDDRNYRVTKSKVQDSLGHTFSGWLH